MFHNCALSYYSTSSNQYFLFKKLFSMISDNYLKLRGQESQGKKVQSKGDRRWEEPHKVWKRRAKVMPNVEMFSLLAPYLMNNFRGVVKKRKFFRSGWPYGLTSPPLTVSRIWKMHFLGPSWAHNEIKCVLGIKESKFSGKNRSTFSHLLTVRAPPITVNLTLKYWVGVNVPTSPKRFAYVGTFAPTLTRNISQYFCQLRVLT